MDNPRPNENYSEWKERNTKVDTHSGEFIDVEVIREGSAARYSLALDRITALEAALTRAVETRHNQHHVGIVNRHVKGWEECGMSSCRVARNVLDNQWWKVDE